MPVFGRALPGGKLLEDSLVPSALPERWAIILVAFCSASPGEI
jgi:hypothetical protein